MLEPLLFDHLSLPMPAFRTQPNIQPVWEILSGENRPYLASPAAAYGLTSLPAQLHVSHRGYAVTPVYLLGLGPARAPPV